MTQAVDWDALRREFPTLEKCTYLDIARKTIPPRCQQHAVESYFRDVYDNAGADAWSADNVALGRAEIAQLLGAKPNEIAFTKNTTEGLTIAAHGFDLRAGDNIVLTDMEHVANIWPWKHWQHKGVEIRYAKNRAGRLPLEAFMEQVDARTRVIGVSYVSYLTGERQDIAALRTLADSVGALLVVDFTQAAGYLPIEASVADFAFSACYKWLLGVTGVAVAYWNRARQPGWSPASAGWYSFAPGSRSYDDPPQLRDDALRFTRGNPAHASAYVLADALDYLAAWDVRDIQSHVQGMTTAMLERLQALQIPTLTPAEPARHGASVCIPSPRAQAIVDAMAQRGVQAWNGMGRIRFSFHGYNARREVDQAIAALRAVWA